MLHIGFYKNLSKAFKFLAIVLILASCDSGKQGVLDEMPPLYSAPQIVTLNTQEGYLINPLTGDSIQPNINSLGDTIITGKPIPAIGKVINLDTVEKPRVYPVGKPKVIPIYHNVYKIPEDLTVIPVNKDSLKTFTPGVDNLSNVLINSSGDTLPTGVPIPAIGEVVPCRHSQPIKALPPVIRKTATCNIYYLGVEHGMSVSHIEAILEDSRGNLWFGTELGGVNMYDGETFTNFLSEHGLCSDWVVSILEDRQGNLWFGTWYGGVCKYDGETFTRYNENGGLSNKHVRSMLEDSHGNLWFGTHGGGVNMYDGESFTYYTRNEGLCNNQVFSILEDSQGNLWFGGPGGVSLYDGDTFTNFTQNEGLLAGGVKFILEDHHGNLWFGGPAFGGSGGVSKYDGKTFTHFTENEGLHNTVFASLEDSHGNLWFGGVGGVSMYNGETFTHFTEKEGLTDNKILSILEDSGGNLWFGTSDGGVNIYKGKTFTYFTQNMDLITDYFLSILEDSHGNLWLGTDYEGVMMYNGETFSHFPAGSIMRGGAVYSILEDSHGNLWFSSWGGGVSVYNGENFTNFRTNQGLSDNRIESMLEDRSGNLWIGTAEGGVNKFDGETFTQFTPKEGFISNNVSSILEDSHGNLWFAGAQGASIYNGETFINFTEKEGLSSNVVQSILEDSHGNFWFGSYFGGVSIFNGESFMHFTEKEGLSSNTVASILEDGNHNLWVGTLNGLNCLMIGQESGAGTEDNLSVHGPLILTYGSLDGLKDNLFYQNSALLDSKNRIWWGNRKGLIMLDPDNLKNPIEPPVIKLNRIEIDGHFIDYRQLDDSIGLKMKFNGVPSFYNYPLNMELPYTSNHLTFHFSARDWAAPHKIKYSYKMEGVDDRWSSPTEEASADYRNMPHGRYTFKVSAIGAAQKWSDPFEYTFRILPPFWLTWWAYMIYGFILLILVRWYRGFLIKREKIKADLKIKEMEVSTMQELDRMKSRFFANISHEFRTPLTLIQGPIEDLRKQFQSSSKGSLALFQTVKRNTKRLQDLINQILDISKLETGKVKLQVSEGNLEQFIRPIILSFLSLAESKNIKYVYDMHVFSDIVFFDSDKVEKILTNLISNAFKFTPEGGKIRVSFEYTTSVEVSTPEYITIKVVDTGRGISGENLDRVFDRFYQVSDSDSRIAEGTGLGLALTKELVDLYRGEISVDSQEGKGSTFTVKLPVSEDLFTEEERSAILSSQDTEAEPSTMILDQQGSEILDVEEEFVRETADHRPVLLIVEDNIDLMNYLSQNLVNNYRIITAINGKTGLEKAVECIPDLIISDVMMPEMGGMEMSRELKSDERTDHIPVIMLTAKADRDSKLEGLETGADDYLIKPFDQEELQVRIKNLLEQRKRLREKFRKEFISDSPDTELPSEDHFLKRLFEIFDQHISEPEFTMNQLSGELYLSLSQVQRKVMATTNYTPSELFRNHRLKKAAALFRGGHTHVAQVMHRVGFNNQSYFTKCFGELYKMTPSQFIAANKK